MRKDSYLPLDICRHVREQESSMYLTAREKGYIPDGMSRSELLDFILKEEFLDINASRKYRELSQVLTHIVYQAAKKNAIHQHNTDTLVEAKDFMAMGDMVLSFAEYKQVYKVDADFLQELIETKNLSITSDALNHLPVDDFYIDFSESDLIDPIRGAFVHAVKNPESPQIAVLMANEDEVLFSYYSNYRYENGVMSLPEASEMLPTAPFVAYSTKEGTPARNYPNDSRPDVIRAIIQIILFITAENKDISESELSKRTYRPRTQGTVVKDKFSEVQIWDVGVRYGSAIRLDKPRRGPAEHTPFDGSGQTPAEAKRKTPKPHLRSAHWHRYYVGKGRKEIRLKWIHPVIVGTKEHLQATIHEIKK